MRLGKIVFDPPDRTKILSKHFLFLSNMWACTLACEYVRMCAHNAYLRALVHACVCECAHVCGRVCMSVCV